MNDADDACSYTFVVLSICCLVSLFYWLSMLLSDSHFCSYFSSLQYFSLSLSSFSSLIALSRSLLILPPPFPPLSFSVSAIYSPIVSFFLFPYAICNSPTHRPLQFRLSQSDSVGPAFSANITNTLLSVNTILIFLSLLDASAPQCERTLYYFSNIFVCRNWSDS